MFSGISSSFRSVATARAGTFLSKRRLRPASTIGASTGGASSGALGSETMSSYIDRPSSSRRSGDRAGAPSRRPRRNRIRPQPVSYGRTGIRAQVEPFANPVQDGFFCHFPVRHIGCAPSAAFGLLRSAADLVDFGDRHNLQIDRAIGQHGDCVGMGGKALLAAEGGPVFANRRWPRSCDRNSSPAWTKWARMRRTFPSRWPVCTAHEPFFTA